MNKTLCFAALLCTSTLSNAATITINNLTGDGQDLVFADSLANPLSSGFVAIYTFPSGNVPSSVSELASNGTTGLLGIASFNSATNDNSQDAGSFTRAFNNLSNTAVQDLYVIIGNGTSVGDSSELGLLDTSLQLDGEDTGPTGDSATYSAKGTAVGEVLIGSVSRADINWSETVGASYNTNVLSLANAVPEPSSLALSGLALFALAGRRSRK